jgi:uncharacterized membrane protein
MAKQMDPQVERLAFFSDAVFAIAITLLVIEIRLPALERWTNDSLIDALIGLMPHYFGFILSFLVIGAFWVSHHRAMAWVRHVDRHMIWNNLHFLLFVAFLPFPTAVMSEHIYLKSGAMFYGIMLTLAALFHLRLWYYVLRTPSLLIEHIPPAEIANHKRRCWGTAVASALGMLALFFFPRASGLVFLLVPLTIRIANLDIMNPKKPDAPSEPHA